MTPPRRGTGATQDAFVNADAGREGALGDPFRATRALRTRQRSAAAVPTGHQGELTASARLGAIPPLAISTFGVYRSWELPLVSPTATAETIAEVFEFVRAIALPLRSSRRARATSLADLASLVLPADAAPTVERR